MRLVTKKELEDKQDLTSSDTSKAYCTLCKSYITYTKGNVNSVYRHMAKRHWQEMKPPESHNDGEKKKQKTLDNHFYNVSQNHNMKLAFRQDQFLGRALLVKWISESLRTFTCVEDSSPERESLDSVGDDSCAYEECVAGVKREIENYLDPSISMPPKTDPLQWWKVNGSRFPKVAMAARKWLCVPRTSTPSERVFSHCGIALSAKRSSMRGEALMNQVLLKNNLRHVLYTVEDIKKALS